MIKEIFLPEKIGTHRILAQHIVGLALHDDAVRLALVYAKRHKNILEFLKEEKIEAGPAETYTDRAAQAIKKIIGTISAYNYVRICIPASIVIFKELQLQFSDPEKIRMVLDYEIETMIPFAINEAIVDFIITKTSKDQGTQVLVAAVRSQDLQAHLSIYEKAGVDPAHITIDLFSLYGLFQQIPQYHSLPNAVALVEFSHENTRVAFIQDGQLRLTRYIQRGMASITKFISDETKLSPEEVEKKLAAAGLYGLNDEVLARSMQKHFVLLLNEVQFTLNSFSLKLNYYEGISKVLFTGYVHTIPNFMEFCSNTIQLPCEIFDCKKLFDTKHIKNKVKSPIDHWNIFTNALGAAIPSPAQELFDLRRKQFAFQRHSLLVKQLAMAVFIIIAMLTGIGIKGFIDLHKLSNEARMFELREINRIKTEDIFTKEQFPRNASLATVVREAERIVRDKLDVWAPFAQQRMRPLDLWLELTRIINRKQFDVSIKEIVFTTQERNWEKEKDGSPKKDAGIPKLEVEGIFKSKTGDHFVDFIPLENRFRDSTILKVIEPIETTPADGVNFSVRMRLKEI